MAGQLFIIIKRQQWRTKSKSNQIQKKCTEREKIALHATRFGLPQTLKLWKNTQDFVRSKET